MKHVKLAGFLTILCLIGFIAAIPYMNAVLGTSPMTDSISLPLAITISLIQQTIMAFVFAWLGLIMAEKLGLDAPILRRWVKGTGSAHFQKTEVWKALLYGVIAILVVIAMEFLIFRPLIPELTSKAPSVPHWAGILTFIQGGVFEEVQLRLFFMTLIVLILYKLFGKGTERKAWMYWTGIFTATILFGIGHLPAVQQIFGDITPLLFVRTILLNGLAGIVFGYLYWKKGLEYAMIAHAIGDIILHGFFG